MLAGAYGSCGPKHLDGTRQLKAALGQCLTGYAQQAQTTTYGNYWQYKILRLNTPKLKADSYFEKEGNTDHDHELWL